MIDRKLKWNKMSREEKDEAIDQSFYGIPSMLRRFIETGCYSEANPNQNQDWCSCTKPFCYLCVANEIKLKLERRLGGNGII